MRILHPSDWHLGSTFEEACDAQGQGVGLNPSVLQFCK